MKADADRRPQKEHNRVLAAASET